MRSINRCYLPILLLLLAGFLSPAQASDRQQRPVDHHLVNDLGKHVANHLVNQHLAALSRTHQREARMHLVIHAPQPANLAAATRPQTWPAPASHSIHSLFSVPIPRGHAPDKFETSTDPEEEERDDEEAKSARLTSSNAPAAHAIPAPAAIFNLIPLPVILAKSCALPFAPAGRLHASTANALHLFHRSILI